MRSKARLSATNFCNFLTGFEMFAKLILNRSKAAAMIVGSGLLLVFPVALAVDAWRCGPEALTAALVGALAMALAMNVHGLRLQAGTERIVLALAIALLVALAGTLALAGVLVWTVVGAAAGIMATTAVQLLSGCVRK
jgi:hypothetical protein